MGGFIGGVIALTVGMFVGLLIAVYIWMGILVSWLDFDYVTASSIFFILSVTGAALTSLFLLFSDPARGVPAAFVYIGLYPLLFSGALRLYEYWSTPEISEATNVVAIYRAAVSSPLTFVSENISAIGPTAAASVAVIEASPLLTQITGAVLASLGTWLITRFSRS